MTPWDILGLPPDASLDDVKRAYAHLVKEVHPEEDAEGFRHLHEAYLAASRMARQKRMQERRTLQETPVKPPVRLPKLPSEPPPPKRAALEESADRTQDWDFERLFSEEQSHRAAALRERRDLLRRNNTSRWSLYDQAQEDEKWNLILPILMMLDSLESTGASLQQWVESLNGQSFQEVKYCPDLLFFLEDLLTRNLQLSTALRNTLIAVYSIDPRAIPRQLQPLSHILRIRRQDVQRVASTAYTVVIVAIALLTAMSFFLTSENALDMLGGRLNSTELSDCLTEDYGGTFQRYESSYWHIDHKLTAGTYAGGYAYIYRGKDVPHGGSVVFNACAEGRRNPEQGKQGYISNYAERRMLKLFYGFAGSTPKARFYGDKLHYHNDPQDQGWTFSADDPAVIEVPKNRNPKEMTAELQRMGDMVTAEQSQPWYWKYPPQFAVVFLYGGTELYRCDLQTELFDTQTLIAAYHDSRS